MTLRPRLALVFIAVLALAPVPRAAAAGKDPPGYTQAVTLGLSEFEEKNFPEARAHFLRAHGLAPSARTLRALGMVEFELKRYAESARLLAEALSSSEKPLDGDKRAHAQQLLERARAYLGTLTLDIEAETAVSVDGVNTNLGPGQELVLEVGDHTLEFQAASHIPQKRALTIRGGERTTLKVRLSPIKAQADEPVASAPQQSAPSERKERRAVKSPWLWTAVGIVVAGAAAGAAIALTRKDPAAKTEEPYPGSIGLTPLGTPR